MLTKNHLIIALCTGTFLVQTTDALAYDAVATVVQSTPITQTVNRPTQQCWTEGQQTVQPPPQEHNYVGGVLGTIAGGLLGSTIGRGSGRVAGAAIGAGIGALTGDALANSDSSQAAPYSVPVQRCQQVDHYETVTTGYQVTFDYDGQRFSTRLPYDPGSRLPINVTVTPRSTQ